MNKTGYVFSLIGGVLAVVFSVLLVVSGPVLFAGEDARDYVDEYGDDFERMWTTFGDYHGVGLLTEDDDLADYVSDYSKALRRTDVDELEEIADEYDYEAFEDLSDLYGDVEGYLPSLRTGIIGCLIASALALLGAQVARRFRIAGGVIVLLGALGTLAFSLVASSIIPMALATLLLIIGGVLQIVKTKSTKAVPIVDGGAMQKIAFFLGYAGSILAIVFALAMIFTVPYGLVTNTLEDIEDDFEMEHVLALNDIAIEIRDENITDLSEDNISAITEDVAERSLLIEDEDYYEEAVEYAYDTGRHVIISMVLVGASIVFALLALIGSLLCKSKPLAGAVMMVIAALVLLITSIYTDTVVPMVIAVVLLILAGVFAFIPRRDRRLEALPNVPVYPISPKPALQPEIPQQEPNEQVPAPPDTQETADADNIAAAQPQEETDGMPFPDDGAQILDEPDKE